MAYTLGNKCAKNLCKRIVLLQLIIENVVRCFFGTQCYAIIWDNGTVNRSTATVPYCFRPRQSISLCRVQRDIGVASCLSVCSTHAASD